jgi:hypothetical protein
MIVGYNATGSLARFESKKILYYILWKTLWPTTTLALYLFIQKS